MLQTPILEIDVHGCTVQQEVEKIESVLRITGNSTYRIRVIHGYHGRMKIWDAIYREFGYELEPRIKKDCSG